VRGACVGQAGYHEACDIDAGPSCISATRCISLDGGTSGTCDVYGINACP
jgi:hypothetical protein